MNCFIYLIYKDLGEPGCPPFPRSSSLVTSQMIINLAASLYISISTIAFLLDFTPSIGYLVDMYAKSDLMKHFMQWALILYGLCKSRQNAISSVIYLQIFITVIYLQMLFFCMLFFCRFFCYFCYFFLYVIFLHVIFLQYNHQNWLKIGAPLS